MVKYAEYHEIDFSREDALPRCKTRNKFSVARHKGTISNCFITRKSMELETGFPFIKHIFNRTKTQDVRGKLLS